MSRSSASRPRFTLARRRRPIAGALVMAAALMAALAPTLAFAAPGCGAPAPIRFAAESAAATVSGGLVRYEDACYRLSAKAGQHIRVSIRSPDRNVVFSLYQPGWKVAAVSADGPDITGVTVAGAGSGDDASSLDARLPKSGSYLLDLGLLRGGGGEYVMAVSVH